MRNLTALVLLSMALLNLPTCSSAAQTVSKQDQAEIECHAAVAAMAGVRQILRAVSSGEQVPDLNSVDRLPPFFSSIVDPSLQKLESDYPNSAPHRQAFYEAVSVDLGEIISGLQAGDTSILGEINAKTQNCKDDYPS